MAGHSFHRGGCRRATGGGPAGQMRGSSWAPSALAERAHPVDTAGFVAVVLRQQFGRRGGLAQVVGEGGEAHGETVPQARSSINDHGVWTPQ